MATTAVTSSTTSSTTNSTTSSSSSTSSTSASSSAKAAASNIVKTLGAGSGIDINSLAQSLVEAEQAPQRDRINTKITQVQSRITGYSAMKFALADLKSAFSSLKDASAFNSLNSSNSQPSAFSVSTTSAASTGTYSVAISQVAKEQRSVASFSSTSASLNGGSGFTLGLNMDDGSASASVSVATDTPAGIVSAINNSADFKALGVSAQLIDTGVSGASRYKLVVTGATGAANAFSLTSASTTTVTFGVQQAAANANFSVNGVDVTRASNTVDDVVQGVTFNLYDTTGTTSTTSGGVTTTTVNSARLALTRDTSAVKSKVQDLVTSYNTFVDSMNVLSDPKSTVDTYGGVLAGDTLLRSVRDQVRNLIIGDSSSAGSNIKALRDVGVSLDRYGKLQLSQTTLDSALSNHFDEVVKMFSANTENQSLYSTDPGGVAGDMVKSLDGMLRSTGLLALQTKTAQDKVTQYNDDMTKLQDQMQRLMDRYLKQFAAMDTIVGNSNSLRTSLQSSFDGMMSMYKK